MDLDLGLDTDDSGGQSFDIGGNDGVADDDECLTLDDIKGNSNSLEAMEKGFKVEQKNNLPQNSRGFIKRFIVPVVLALGAFIVAANPLTEKLLSKFKKFNKEYAVTNPVDELLDEAESSAQSISLGINNIGFIVQSVIFLIIFAILNSLFG